MSTVSCSSSGGGGDGTVKSSIGSVVNRKSSPDGVETLVDHTSGSVVVGSNTAPSSEISLVSNDDVGQGGEDVVNCDNSDQACLQLALEGERLCKTGNCRDGVAFFEAALQSGTHDFRTLSAIYSQLGNAYFYLGDYVSAMQYHKHDLTLARTMGDKLGEAKASGNLGNTLKVMGKFEEAVLCCRRHLEICQDHNDRIGEGRALYNLGNVYHAKGKHLGRLGHQDPGDFPDEVRNLFEKAVEYYEDNLSLMEEMKDRAAQGRSCGNLGNVHYLLGNFSKAIFYHQQRLKIAKEFGDRAAERRARSNLGNAHIFLGQFEKACDHYKKTLTLAEELNDRAVEAQACYSLGNTYTLLNDYPTAIQFHLKHLHIAQQLNDKVGEGRACWSLGNAHSSLKEHGEAYSYATRHLQLARATHDKVGENTATANIKELCQALGYQFNIDNIGQSSPNDGLESDGSTLKKVGKDEQKEVSEKDGSSMSRSSLRRISMEHMDILKMTPEANKHASGSKKGQNRLLGQIREGNSSTRPQNQKCKEDVQQNVKQQSMSSESDESSILEDDLFDCISRLQSQRMDDQRCPISTAVGFNTKSNQTVNNSNNLTKHQSLSKQNGNPSNYNQSLSLSSKKAKNVGGLLSLPGFNAVKGGGSVSKIIDMVEGNDDVLLKKSDSTEFLDMLVRCQSHRLDGQRSYLASGSGSSSGSQPSAPTVTTNENREEGKTSSITAPTVPDEDFFSLVLKLQGHRIDDQRATLPNL